MSYASTARRAGRAPAMANIIGKTLQLWLDRGEGVASWSTTDRGSGRAWPRRQSRSSVGVGVGASAQPPPRSGVGGLPPGGGLRSAARSRQRIGLWGPSPRAWRRRAARDRRCTTKGTGRHLGECPPYCAPRHCPSPSNRKRVPPPLVCGAGASPRPRGVHAGWSRSSAPSRHRPPTTALGPRSRGRAPTHQPHCGPDDNRMSKVTFGNPFGSARPATVPVGRHGRESRTRATRAFPRSPWRWTQGEDEISRAETRSRREPKTRGGLRPQ
jgi:hypothetical protein